MATKLYLGRSGYVDHYAAVGTHGRVAAIEVMNEEFTKQFLEQNRRMMMMPQNKRASGRMTHFTPTPIWQGWRDEWKRSGASKVMSWNEFRNRKLNAHEHASFRASKYRRL